MRLPVLAAHQRRIRRRMSSRVKVITIGAPQWDPVTDNTTAPEITAWEGPGIVRPSPRDAKRVEVAGEMLDVRTYDVTLPVAAVVPLDAFLEVTACPTEPRLVGARMGIIDNPLDDLPTAVRLVCQVGT